MFGVRITWYAELPLSPVNGIVACPPLVAKSPSRTRYGPPDGFSPDVSTPHTVACTVAPSAVAFRTTTFVSYVPDDGLLPPKTIRACFFAASRAATPCSDPPGDGGVTATVLPVSSPYHLYSHQPPVAWLLRVTRSLRPPAVVQ
ncbi:hypothetical protein GCM10009558_053340 [Virgisporangium aurantiacum]